MNLLQQFIMVECGVSRGDVPAHPGEITDRDGVRPCVRPVKMRVDLGRRNYMNFVIIIVIIISVISSTIDVQLKWE